VSERKIRASGYFDEGHLSGMTVIATGKTSGAVIADFLSFTLGSSLNPVMTIEIGLGEGKEVYDVKFKIDSIEERR
jgi:hypothetical protein